jgi:putative sugar O-methyltransferase
MKYLFLKIIRKLYPYYRGLLILIYKKDNPIIKLSISKPIVMNNSDYSLIKRIFTSYKKMKKSQIKLDKIYQPSTLWKNHLEKDYRVMQEAYLHDDYKKFSFFLKNFGNWDKYLGIEHNLLLKSYNKNFILRKYLKCEIFDRLFKAWKYFTNDQKKVCDLSSPEFGNQIGAYINNNFVTIGSFFNNIIAKLLTPYIDKKKRVVVADLGGGYGKLGYYLLKKKKNFCFIDFDLPETLCLASYYLMKTWPNKKALLYGEKVFSSHDLKIFDLIFMPSFEIKKLKINSIDLFLNKNSLGEMNPDLAVHFISYICKATKFFFHMNHEKVQNIFENNIKSLVNSKYPINNKKFKLLFRYPDLGHSLYTGRIDFINNDIFMYLFKKNSYKI